MTGGTSSRTHRLAIRRGESSFATGMIGVEAQEPYQSGQAESSKPEMFMNQVGGGQVSIAWFSSPVLS